MPAALMKLPGHSILPDELFRLREPCEFIMTNLQYGLRLYLRQAAVGLEPAAFFVAGGFSRFKA
jgi:hypothetical protein